MTTPAPSLVLRIKLDKDGPYQPGDEVAVDVLAYTQDSDTVTISGTAPDGTTVNASVDVPVLVPADGVSLGISSGRGIAFTQEDGPDGSKVFRGVIVSLAPVAQ